MLNWIEDDKIALIKFRFGRALVNCAPLEEIVAIKNEWEANLCDNDLLQDAFRCLCNQRNTNALRRGTLSEERLCDVARWLLEVGADPNEDVEDVEERPVLVWAMVNGLDKLAQLLVKHGANFDITFNADEDCVSALLFATSRGLAATTRLLLEKYATSRPPDGGWHHTGIRSELMVEAMQNGHVDVVRVFLEMDTPADIILPFHDSTLLREAAIMADENKAREFIDLLLHHGADVDSHCRDVNYCAGGSYMCHTAALEAAKRRRFVTARYLLSKGGTLRKEAHDPCCPVGKATPLYSASPEEFLRNPRVSLSACTGHCRKRYSVFYQTYRLEEVDGTTTLVTI